MGGVCTGLTKGRGGGRGGRGVGVGVASSPRPSGRHVWRKIMFAKHLHLEVNQGVGGW